ncbi:50S ribosomal protein L5 [Elusimicrobiota bacterium]
MAKSKTGRKIERKSTLPTGLVEKNQDLPRLKVFYFGDVVPGMRKDLDLDNHLQVPRLLKIIVSMGVTEAKENIQALDTAREDLGLITGQLPQIRRAKKSISNFKLRAGMPIGLRVTLRGDRMYEFLDRLVATAVPRIRDFRGLEPKCFDGRGNYNLGLKEHHIFSELDLEKSPTARGMNITFVTTADTDDEGLELLSRMGMPFKKKSSGKKGE